MCVVARMSISFIEKNTVEVGKSSSTCSRMGREAVRCCCLDSGVWTVRWATGWQGMWSLGLLQD
jgi:hypothetical protein